MFRSLIIIAALALVYLLVKNRLQSRTIQKPGTGSNPSEDTVQCLECKTFIPATEAITSGSDIFCCKQHQRDWQDEQDQR